MIADEHPIFGHALEGHPIVDHFLYIHKFMTLLLKDYYLIPDNGAKNLLRPFFICMKRWNYALFFKMTHLKFVCVVLITASAKGIQVIKVDI